MKDSTVSARVENDVKKEAEDILQKLGVPVSVVINSLYRQIIYRHGIPFSLTIPDEPQTLDAMTDAELDAKLEQVPEGKRNSTRSHIAGNIIKRYGNTDKAYEIYLEKSELCNPPLSESELNLIWKSA